MIIMSLKQNSLKYIYCTEELSLPTEPLYRQGASIRPFVCAAPHCRLGVDSSIELHTAKSSFIN